MGLIKRLQLPGWLEVLLSVVLLDYSLYLWHAAAGTNPGKNPGYAFSEAAPLLAHSWTWETGARSTTRDTGNT